MTVLASQTGGPLDLLAAMQTLALDIAGRSMFSLETRQYGAAMRRLLTEFSLNYARPHLLDMVLPPSVPTLTRPWAATVPASLDGTDRYIIQTRLTAPPTETPRDLFDLLLAARDPETGAGFTREQLRDQVATLILAGHETTAVTLFWSLVLLAGAPDEQERVAEEAAGATVVPETPCCDAALVRTRAVMNETLRLFPGRRSRSCGRRSSGPERRAGDSAATLVR